LIFIRSANRTIGKGTWTEICAARNVSKPVFLARNNKHGLVLVPWSKLAYTLNKDGSDRDYATFRYDERYHGRGAVKADLEEELVHVP
ncbi:MAG: hypothetical protein KGL39_60080, partial [Patescibacteria group bacterium]|nr:hypothetical protein [Patescibacteria group bacterium]